MSGLLQVEDLSIRVGESALLTSASFEVEARESLAIVGASGSGKTTLLNAMAGFLPPGGHRSGEVLFEGASVFSPAFARTLRGSRIAMVPQDAQRSLDPVWRVGSQFVDALRAHAPLSRAAARGRAAQLLASVGLADPRRVMRSFPHQLSGGMCQRVLIAMALAHEPQLILFDEPTSMLDDESADQVMTLIENVRQRAACAIVVVTHDPAVARRLCRRAIDVQEGSVTPIDLVDRPRVRARPPQASEGEPVVVVRGATVRFGKTVAIDSVSLSIDAGETVAVVGPSGGGKSTLARTLVGLQPLNAGTVDVDGVNVAGANRRQLRSLRGRVQLVSQDPYSALDPRLTIRRSVEEFLRVGAPVDARRIDDALGAAGLQQELGDRLPHELSGGQLQRACLARAIVTRPRLLVLDEPTSALDVEVRAGLIETIARLSDELSMACLFISHDLETVEAVASRIVRMEAGRLTVLTR